MVGLLSRPIKVGLPYGSRGEFLLKHGEAIILKDLGEGLEEVEQLQSQVYSLYFIQAIL